MSSIHEHFLSQVFFSYRILVQFCDIQSIFPTPTVIQLSVLRSHVITTDSLKLIPYGFQITIDYAIVNFKEIFDNRFPLYVFIPAIVI